MATLYGLTWTWVPLQCNILAILSHISSCLTSRDTTELMNRSSSSTTPFKFKRYGLIKCGLKIFSVTPWAFYIVVDSFVSYTHQAYFLNNLKAVYVIVVNKFSYFFNVEEATRLTFIYLKISWKMDLLTCVTCRVCSEKEK